MFPSFKEALSPALYDALIAEGPWDEFFRPIFNVQRFTVSYTSNVGGTEPLMTELFAARPLLLLADCEAYNRWLLAKGFVKRTMPSLSGICTKEKESCKNFERFSCGGCGRTVVPGSLKDPACVVYDPPWWAYYIRDEIEAEIEKAGGVSKTDPLWWFPLGPFRHGRTVHYNPVTNVSKPAPPKLK